MTDTPPLADDLAAGLVSHTAAVERNWFQHYLGGKPREDIAGNARGDDPSWDVGTDKTPVTPATPRSSASRSTA